MTPLPRRSSCPNAPRELGGFVAQHGNAPSGRAVPVDLHLSVQSDEIGHSTTQLAIGLMWVAVDAIRWLDDDEQRAWRALIVCSNRLKAVLDAELVAEHDLPFGDYEVLVVLSEAPDRRLRMSELAERLFLSPSGLTRRLDRLTRDGLVAREQCPFDRRGTFAVLTDHGFERLEQAVPCHVRGVREHFVDLLDRRQLLEVGRALEAVAEECPSRGPASVRAAAN